MTDPTERQAETMAQRQLDAYNARDLDAFVACYAKDVEVRDQKTGDLMMKGHTALRERYGALFGASPKLHCELVNRIVMGSFVFDQERVTGRNGGNEVARVVAIYEVEGDAIAKVWFARP